jgi:K+ transporter
MKAILSGASGGISEGFVLGALSCIIWTLTLQTTIKYVIIAIRADNKGEGGIMSIYAIVRKQGRWIFVPAIIGAAALLADGIITPSITIMSATEGLTNVNAQIPVVLIALIIITVLFTVQQFGTSFIGRSFGPVKFNWFLMLATLGFALYFRQAMISGSYTIISEAIQLNFWPKFRISHHTIVRRANVCSQHQLVLIFGLCGCYIVFPKIIKHGSRLWSFDCHHHADDHYLIILLPALYKT